MGWHLNVSRGLETPSYWLEPEKLRERASLQYTIPPNQRPLLIKQHQLIKISASANATFLHCEG